MTGIQIPTVPRPSKFDQPFERYAQLKLCPERYSIVQIGICVFEENPEFRKYAKRVTTVTRSHLGDDNVGVDNVNDNDNGGDMNIDNDKTNDNNQEDQEAQRLLHAMPLEATQHDKNDNSSDEEGISSSSSFNSDNENDDDHVSNNSNSDSDSDQAHQHGRGHGRGRNVHYINDRGRDVGHDNDHDNAHDIDNAHDNDGNNHRRNRPRSLRNEPPEFLIHKYNFLIFPSSDSTREVVMNPKSIQHLNHSSRQGMFLSHHSDFNWEEWIKHGIPYLSLDIAQEELMKFQKEHNRDAFDQNGNSKSNANANVNENGTNNLQEGETHAHAQVPHCSSEEVAQEWEEPSDPADVAFIARAMANLREWIDSAAGNRGGLDENGQLLSLSDNLTLAQEQRLGIVKILPQTKKESLKKCLRRKIENEYPALHWDMNDNHEVLVRLNDDEKRIRDARRKKFAWQKMHEEKIGFTRVFKALSDACRGELGNTGDLDEEYRSFLDEANRNIGANDIGNDTNDEWVIPKVGDGDGDTDEVAFHNTTNPDKDSKQEEWVCGSLLTNQSEDKRRKVPIIVHNGFLDLLFLMTHFQRHKLPPTYEEGKNLARHYFPLIYDTKVLATELSDFSIRSRSSSLVDLHQRYVRGDGVGDIDGFVELHLDVIPRSIIVNSGHVHRDDAVMIGTVFQCLCRRIKWGSDSYNGLDNDDKRRKLFKAVATAKKSRVGSLLFLNESLPESKLSAPLYGLNKVRLFVRRRSVSQPIFSILQPQLILDIVIIYLYYRSF